MWKTHNTQDPLIFVAHPLEGLVDPFLLLPNFTAKVPILLSQRYLCITVLTGMRLALLITEDGTVPGPD